jgi:hypothetical protein
VSDETAIPQPEEVNARWLLDTAIEKADQESADGLFSVYVPVFGRKVIMKRLSFSEMGQVRRMDADAAQRVLLRLSIVEPPFSPKEVDELLDNAKLFPAATILSNAVNKINHLTEAEQAVVDARFQDSE